VNIIFIIYNAYKNNNPAQIVEEIKSVGLVKKNENNMIAPLEAVELCALCFIEICELMRLNVHHYCGLIYIYGFFKLVILGQCPQSFRQFCYPHNPHLYKL
jgi:hypothetical protein